MRLLSRVYLQDGMAVTVMEHETTGNLHVGLLDVDSGNYVDGSIRIFPYDNVSREGRDAANAYVDELMGVGRKATVTL